MAPPSSVATTVLYTKDSSVTSGKPLVRNTFGYYGQLPLPRARRFLSAFPKEMNGCAACMLMRVSRGGGGRIKRLE